MEAAAVAAALDVRLSVTVEKRLEDGIRVGDHKTSMLQDLEAGRRRELDCIVGVVVELADRRGVAVELADRRGVAVPHTRTLYACVKLLDAIAAPQPPSGR